MNVCKCIGAGRTCKVTGNRCILTSPDSKVCRAIYGEGPDVTNDDKVYTVLINRSDIVHIYSDTDHNAIVFVKKYFGGRVHKVLPPVKEIDFDVNYNTDKPQFTLDYNEYRLLYSHDNIRFYNNDTTDSIIIPSGIESITGIALTEDFIMVQHIAPNRRVYQKNIKLTKDLNILLRKY